MRLIRSCLFSLLAGLGICALGSTAVRLCLSLYDVPHSAIIPFGVWISALFAAALLSAVMSRFSVNALVQLVVLVPLCGAGVFCIMQHTRFTPAAPFLQALLTLLAAFSLLAACIAAFRFPSCAALVRCMDALGITLLGYLFLVHALGRPLDSVQLAFSLTVFCCLVWGISHLRAQDSSPVIMGSGGALIGCIALCPLAFAALLFPHLQGVGNLFDLLLLLWHGTGRICAAVMRMLAVPLGAMWGSGPALRADPVSAPLDTTLSVSGTGGSSGMPVWLEAILCLVLLLVLCSLLARLIRALRAMHPHAAPEHAVMHQRSRVLSSLRQSLTRIKERLVFAYRLHFGPRTPQRLLVLAQRLGAQRKLPRLPAESGGKYLRRLHTHLAAQDKPCSLDELAAMLDLALYAGTYTELSKEAFAAYLAQIRSVRAPSV